MVGTGIWRETLKNVQIEKHTLQDLGYGEKTDKGGKYDTYTVGPGKWRETVKT